MAAYYKRQLIGCLSQFRTPFRTESEHEMVDILHRVGIEATPQEVYEALATVDGLASWWTR